MERQQEREEGSKCMEYTTN